MVLVSATPREVDVPDLDICMLDVVIDDLMHAKRYDIVLVGTPRGLTFTVERKRKLRETKEGFTNGADS